MRRIDAIYEGTEYTFRSNDNGTYLYVGISENKQISVESGFDSLKRMKKVIRDYIHKRNPGYFFGTARIRYTPDSSTWKP